jgi:O-acetyl-ADP-ribose deacetylase (regulator of RNase III)
MSITFKRGDLLKSGCEVLVNTTNCVGVMGAGIALQFKRAYPSMFLKYRTECMKYEFKGGDLRAYMQGPTMILCFMTKEHWKDPSKMEWIERGLIKLREHLMTGMVKSIAIPPLGCGNGGLKWDEVKPLIIKHLTDVPCDIQVFEP